MAIEENSAQSTAAGFQFAMPGSAEWMKSFSQLPTRIFVSRWRDALGLTAGFLEDQADYFTRLAECADPAQVLKCNAEFVRKSWIRSCNEGFRIIEGARTKVSAALPAA